MNWMIYPAARAFIKVCAVLFGAGAAAAVLIHLFMPFFLRSPRTAAPFLLLGTGAELLSILSLSFLMFWGARVLLASRGSRITRNLSMLAFLPALYALLIPFAGMPVPSQYTEMDRVWEAVLLLAAVTSFFSFPYTAGYEAAGRRLFLAWGIAAAGCGLQSALFFLPSCCVSSCPPQFPPWQRLLHGWPFFCPAAWKSCWRPFPFFWRSACLKRSCP